MTFPPGRLASYGDNHVSKGVREMRSRIWMGALLVGLVAALLVLLVRVCSAGVAVAAVIVATVRAADSELKEGFRDRR